MLREADEVQRTRHVGVESSRESPFSDRLEGAFQTARSLLFAERTRAGHWIGELATSALSTATAVGAFALLERAGHGSDADRRLIERGLVWLEEQQNEDGGWGDTDRSLSNISTTMLCRAAFHLAGQAEAGEATLKRAIAYLDKHCGEGIANHAEGIRRRYGKDRTFSVPILATCAHAGLVAWNEVPRLPFELACFPQSWFRFLQLPVVSYALPALIALGQAIHAHRPPLDPVTRMIRRLARNRSLRVLDSIQPESGGFLEATPLTSFVVMSLASIGHGEHPVARLGTKFLRESVRPDGSWPIDSNLSVWVTTLSINALAAAGEADSLEVAEQLTAWLLAQQGKVRHPYTGAEPGAWGWSHLPGSVPDADDTAGALLALSHLPMVDSAAITAGLRWLLRLQNRDGGWPTFCRGWGHLPFDRSGADLTAHALRAFATWLPNRNSESVGSPFSARKRQSATAPHWSQLRRAISHGFEYLERTQRPDGAWLPLWFGNQHGQDDENPTFGTARVLAAYAAFNLGNATPARRGLDWLFRVQNGDGSWGGDRGIAGTVEETALALDAVMQLVGRVNERANRGLRWLVEAVERGDLLKPQPIGFYFAKLWYYERLYPIIFTVAALGRARLCVRSPETASP